MTRRAYPEFHKAMMEQAFYPSAPRRIKYEETRTSYLYRTGDHVYKIRKASPVYSSLAIKEKYAQEALTLGQRWAPDVFETVWPISRTEGGYALGEQGEVVTYAVVMRQLPAHYWLHELIANDKFTQTLVGRLARFLAEVHTQYPVEEKSSVFARPEHLRELVDEVFYQAKKYIGTTLQQPLYDLVSRPMMRFLDESKRLLQRRVRKGRMVDGHGAFVPEHIHIKGRDIHAVSPLDGLAKLRIMDAANDVATLVNELIRREAAEQADLFVKRYATATKDRDLTRVLPAFQTFQAMRSGVLWSERQAESTADESKRAEMGDLARAYFNMAMRFAREIPKDLR